MKNFNLLFLLASCSFIFVLSGCNGGMNLSIANPTAEGSGLTQNDPAGTPTPTPMPSASPTPTPDNGPQGKNRIFVSTKMVTAINAQNGTYFDTICNTEAKKANLSGTFAALTSITHGIFATSHAVNGYIYQKVGGAEVRVADSYPALIAGKNDGVYSTANQQVISNSYKNFAWTGQNNFNQPASPDLNCADWSTDHGYGIVGLVGARGSDALANRYQTCDVIAHLYCIETN